MAKFKVFYYMIKLDQIQLESARRVRKCKIINNNYSTTSQCIATPIMYHSTFQAAGQPDIKSYLLCVHLKENSIW